VGWEKPEGTNLVARPQVSQRATDSGLIAPRLGSRATPKKTGGEIKRKFVIGQGAGGP